MMFHVPVAAGAGLSLSEFGGSLAWGGIFVVLALVCFLASMVRGRKLERKAGHRQTTFRERTALREMKKQRNMLRILAAVLLVIGVILAVLMPAVTDSVETTVPTEPPTEETEPDLTGIPQSLLELMEKNPETTEFVLNYKNRQPEQIDLSTIDRSAGVPLFLQWDTRWGYEIYGNDVLAITGCAPTCAAMVGYYLTGDEKFTPDQMAEFAYEDGHYSSGTNWTFVQDGLEKLGLVTTELPLMESSIARNLEAGNPIIINVGPGDFTTTGHYMVMVGYEDGMIRINDPNSRIKSEQLWSYETLEPQIRNLWAVKAAG